MNEYTQSWTATFLPMEDDLKREFELRVSESSTLAFRVAFGVLRNREDAEDVTQETFARAYRQFSKLRDRNCFRSWLVRMTWRAAIDHQRSRRRRTAREEMEPAIMLEASQTDDLVAKERAAKLWHAIDALPQKLRMTIVLAGIEEYDTREVANLLGVPEGTVKSRLFLARKRLKDLLQ